MKLLFLGCGDLMNPLTTATGSCKKIKNLQIHINDGSLPVIARNILVLKIVSSNKFSPENVRDMEYLWDIWYNRSWLDSTLKRFVEDIKSLLDQPLPDEIIISNNSSHLFALKEIWTWWLSTVLAKQ